MLLLKQLKRNFSSFPKLEYRTISANSFDKVIEYLRNTFFIDEPLSKAVRLYEPGLGNAELERYCHKTMEENVSHMAINEKKEIVAVMLNGILECGYVQATEKYLSDICDENFIKILSFINMVNKRANIFERFDVKQIFDIRVLSVDERYRGTGISNELLKRSEQSAKDCECKLIKTDATGLYSQRVFRCNGFTMLEEYSYDIYVDEKGEPIFKVDSPHTKLELLVKSLDSECLEKSKRQDK